MMKLADDTTAEQDTKPVPGGPTNEPPPVATSRDRLVPEVPGGSTEEPPLGTVSLAPNGGSAEGSQGNNSRG